MAYDKGTHEFAMSILGYEEGNMAVLNKAAHELAQQLQDTIDSFLMHELRDIRWQHAQAQRDKEDYARDLKAAMKRDDDREPARDGPDTHFW